MYSDIFEGGSTETIPFAEAFEQLKAVYAALDAENRAKFKSAFTRHYRRVVQLNITDRAQGTATVIFSSEDNGAHFDMVPYSDHGADAYVTASFDHLLGMAQGTVSFDKIFLSGLLKVEGNLSKGAEIRQLLCRSHAMINA